MFKLPYNFAHFTCYKDDAQSPSNQASTVHYPRTTDVQAGFEREEARYQIAKIMEKAKEFQKNIYFCFIDYSKDFDCGDHNRTWKILKEM